MPDQQNPCQTDDLFGILDEIAETDARQATHPVVELHISTTELAEEEWEVCVQSSFEPEVRMTVVRAANRAEATLRVVHDFLARLPRPYQVRVIVDDAVAARVLGRRRFPPPELRRIAWAIDDFQLSGDHALEVVLDGTSG